jgi:hypothetical protein
VARKALPVLFLVGVNTVPVFGVVFFGWSLFSILLLYWFENGMIGLFNVPKIALAREPVSASFTVNGRPAGPRAKAFIIPFFVFHYGLFWIVHGVFVLVFFGFMGGQPFGSAGPVTDPLGGFRGFDPTGIAVAAAALFLSHGVSFFVNFLGNREYENVSPDEQMLRPYPRVIVLHATILGGGFLAGYFGAPLASLVLMVALKTTIDLYAHLREHREAEKPPARGPDPTRENAAL